MTTPEQIEAEIPFGWSYYLKIFVRSRWWFITTVVTVWVASLVLAVCLPAKYKSETLVLVEPGAAPAQYVTPNLSLDLQQRLRSLAEQTLGRPRLVQLIQQFHLYGLPEGKPVSDGLVKRMRDDISVELTKAGGGDISAFKISYSGATPESAQNVTSALTSLFIQDSLSRQQSLSDDTASFLTTQLQQAHEEVEKRDALLRQIKSKNLGELPEQRATNIQILSGLQDRLRSATESLHQAEKQKLYLGSMIGWNGNAGANANGDAPPTGATPIAEQIDKMKAELARLSAQYTPQHPDIVHLKDQIANAEKQKSEMEADASKKPEQPGALSETMRNQRAISPLAQLQSQYKANELEITNRKQEIKDLERQIGLYQARLTQMPVTEQQMADATRNFEQAQTHYESLLAKKQQAEMATDLSRTQQNAQFRTIDPPTLPQKAYWPNRLKFSLIGIFAGIVLGLAGIGVREAVDARIMGEEDLSRWVQVPVIGTVPSLSTPGEQNSHARRRHLEIALASLLALAVPVLTLLVYLRG